MSVLKKILDFVIVIAFNGGVLLFAQGVETPVSASDPYGIDFSKLQGDVSQVTEYRGERLDLLRRYSTQIYDAGKISSTTLYEINGSVRVMSKYEYDDSGKLISIKGIDNSENIKWSYQYSYNKDGRQIEEKSISSDNKAEGKITSRYNENGSLRERLTYDSSEKITLKETFHYNDRGFVSADISQYPDGKLLRRIIYTYTKGGHVAQEDHFDASGFYESIGYSYTEAGNIISFSNVGKKGVMNSRTVLVYDSNGKISRQIITDKDDLRTEISYTYDYRNNWVIKYDGKSYIIREIIYKN